MSIVVYELYALAHLQIGAIRKIKMRMKLSAKIKQLRNSLRLNQAAFGKLFSVDQSTVSRWEKAQNPSVPELPYLRTMADLAKVTLDDFVKDTDYAAEMQPQLKKVGVVSIGAIVHFFSKDEEMVDVEGYSGAPEGTEALEIKDGALGVEFDGWLAFFNSISIDVHADLIGKPCIVWLADGRVLFRRVEHGERSGRFTLLSSFSPPIYDAEIKQVARILHMHPQRP
jgi:DNA-binding transcriptional regulator YiaG